LWAKVGIEEDGLFLGPDQSLNELWRPGTGGLGMVGGEIWRLASATYLLPTALPSPPEGAALVATARGKIPFSTTAFIRDSNEIIIVAIL
jgi:hypothetical protein